MTLCFLILTLLMAGGCKPKDRTPIEEHEHSYASSYEFDDVFHWRVCQDEDCMEISEEEEHTLVKGKCFCGYVEQDTDGGDADEDYSY